MSNALYLAGYWSGQSRYRAGAMVFHNGRAYVAAEGGAQWGDPVNGSGWFYIGQYEPHVVDHTWEPEEVRYPLDIAALTLSDPAVLCAECFRTGNFKHAFYPKGHQYVIHEEVFL